MRTAYWLGMALGAALAAPAIAQPGVRLTAGDAIFDYAFPGTLPAQSNGPAGDVPMNFQLGGPPLAPGTNWMPNGNWFYRFSNDNRERQLTNLGTHILTGTNDVEYVVPTMYTGGAANAIVPDATGHLHFHVDDTGINKARLTTQFCIENGGSTPLIADVFCMLNIDVLATPLGDTFGPLMITATDRQWTATDGFGLAKFLGPGAISAGVGDAAAMMGNMTDSNLDNFNSVGPFPPNQDAYAAMQFHVIVPPLTTYCVPAFVDIEIVPEPTSAMLLLAGLALLRRRG